MEKRIDSDGGKDVKVRIVALLYVFCAICGLMQSCAVRQADATEVLERLLSSQGEVPVGRRYALQVSADGAEDADEALLVQLFGRGGQLPAALALPVQGAFFLSVSAPFELMVFQCSDRGDAQQVATLCLERQHALCSFWQDSERVMQSFDAAAVEPELPPCGVTVRGRWVLAYLCPQEKACLRAFQRSI